MKRHNRGPTLLAALGISIMLAALALHWWRPALYPVEWSVQCIGAAIAFAGFYAMDPTRAKDGGGFLVDAGTKIVAVIRTGKRASDPVVTVTKADDESPAPPPSNPVRFVTGPDDGVL